MDKLPSPENIIHNSEYKPFKPFTCRERDIQSNDPAYVATLTEECSTKEEITDFSIDFLFRNHEASETLVGIHIYYTKTEFQEIKNLFELIFMAGITDLVRIIKDREFDKILNCLYVYAQCLIFCSKQPQEIKDREN